ncbi:MAG: BTAD domain-containing putative transcriptional regulator [Chloroflexota bacterium]
MSSKIERSHKPLEFILLGPHSIQLNHQRINEFSTSKSQALLIYLAVTARVHVREELATLLWQDMSSDNARRNLRGALSNLRKLVGDFLLITPKVVGWREECSYDLDVARFRAHIDSKTAQDSAELHQAVTLYQGDFLESFSPRNAPAFDKWAQQERNTLRRLNQRAILDLIQIEIKHKNYTKGLEVAERLLRLEPANEDGHFFKIQLLAWLGDRDAALDQYKLCRQHLLQQYGLEPLPRTSALFEAIKTGRIKAKRDSGNQRLSSYAESTRDEKPGSTVSAPSQNSTHPAHNLPSCSSAYSSPFVGREREIQYVYQFLGDSSGRLLTILGAGGMGKTRLLLEVLWEVLRKKELLPNDVDSIFFIPLAEVDITQLNHPERDEQTFVEHWVDIPNIDLLANRIAIAIAHGMDLRLDGQQSPKAQLLTYLQSKRILLCLDNFEHLCEAASFLMEILQRAPYSRLIVTSREALQLYPERQLLLYGLDRSTDVNGDEIDPAYQLFRNRISPPKVSVQSPEPVEGDVRLRQAQPTWGSEHLPQKVDASAEMESSILFQSLSQDGSGETRQQIDQIIRLVGGMPLGIEIVAALSNRMSLAKIIDELQSGIEILWLDQADLASRHRNIKVMLDVCWQRLSPNEQEILAKLSVFRGGFTADAAAAVVGATKEDLSSLVNRSLLWLTSNRYELHAIVLQYASDHLTAAYQVNHPLVTNLRADHQIYYQALLHQSITKWRQSHQRKALELLTVENGNLSAGWQWLLGREDPVRLNSYLEDFWHYAQASGRLHEIEIGLNEALHIIERNVPTSMPQVQARWYQLLGSTYFALGRITESNQCASQALKILGQEEPRSRIRLLLVALIELGKQLWNRFRNIYVSDIGTTDWSNSDRTNSDATHTVAGWAYTILCQNGYLSSTMPQMLVYALKSVNLAEQTNHSALVAFGYAKMIVFFGLMRMNWLSRIYIVLAQKAAHQAQDLLSMPLIHEYHGLYSLSCGHLSAAQEQIELALSQYEQLSDWRNAGDCLALLNQIAVIRGQHKRGKAYGERLEALSAISQNVEHQVWGIQTQASNLIYLDALPEAQEYIERLKPLYGSLNAMDIGRAVGYTTVAYSQFRMDEHSASLKSIAVVKDLMANNIPTSSIYLYIYHAILEVYFGIFDEMSQSTAQSDTRPQEIKQQFRYWLRRLTLFTWLHPIGKMFSQLHQGRYHRMMGKTTKARRIWQKGLYEALQQTEFRAAAVFHFELGRTNGATRDERIRHLQSAVTLFGTLDTPYEVAQANQTLTSLLNKGNSCPQA